MSNGKRTTRNSQHFSEATPGGQPGETKPSRPSPGGPPAYHVSIEKLKPHREHRKGLKAAAVLIQQQRKLFEPEISVTVWKQRGSRG